MADEDKTESPADDDADETGDDETGDDETGDDGVLSNYGIASIVLALLSVAAVVLAVFIYRAHHNDLAERRYLTRVLETAVDWTNVLINMNSSNIDHSLQKLHDGTVGDLNTFFDGAVQPYRQVVEKLQSQSVGQIESVAVETVHHDLDTQPGASRPVVTTKLPAFASRSDAVMVVATSISQNAGTKPQIVHWSLRLDISDIDGKLMISRLESIK